MLLRNADKMSRRLVCLGRQSSSPLEHRRTRLMASFTVSLNVIGHTVGAAVVTAITSGALAESIG